MYMLNFYSNNRLPLSRNQWECILWAWMKMTSPVKLPEVTTKTRSSKKTTFEIEIAVLIFNLENGKNWTCRDLDSQFGSPFKMNVHFSLNGNWKSIFQTIILAFNSSQYIDDCSANRVQNAFTRNYEITFLIHLLFTIVSICLCH